MSGSPIHLAATGDLNSLRQLAECSYNSIGTADPALVQGLYLEAITFSRLGAAIGERMDSVNLIFLLSDLAGWWGRQGRNDLAATFEGQALAWAEELAEGGDQEIANMIVAAGDRLPAEAFAVARHVREQVGQLFEGGL